MSRHLRLTTLLLLTLLASLTPAPNTIAASTASQPRVSGDTNDAIPRRSLPEAQAVAATTITAPLPQISAGESHTCAVNTYGLVHCWGNNAYGQTDVPSNLGTVSAISAGDTHTCVVTTSNTLRCWGDNSSEQASVPSDLGAVNAVSAGGLHTCAVTTSGALRCWGYNSDGQTDVPTDTATATGMSATPTPTLIATPTATATPTVGNSPTLTINFSDGTAGSVFVITGSGYPANRTLTVSINGVPLEFNLSSDASGTFRFLITTDAGAVDGSYLLTVTINGTQRVARITSAATRYQLDATAPVRTAPISDPPMLNAAMPTNIPLWATRIFLPAIQR